MPDPEKLGKEDVERDYKERCLPIIEVRLSAPSRLLYVLLTRTFLEPPRFISCPFNLQLLFTGAIPCDGKQDTLQKLRRFKRSGTNARGS